MSFILRHPKWRPAGEGHGGGAFTRGGVGRENGRKTSPNHRMPTKLRTPSNFDTRNPKITLSTSSSKGEGWRRRGRWKTQLCQNELKFCMGNGYGV